MQANNIEPLEHIFSHLKILLQSEFNDDLLGILVTGSRIHGTPGPTSDLDVHVIIASHRRQRRNILLEGIEIEMFINPAFQIRRYMADPDGLDQHMFSFGQAIHDPYGIVANLQAEARNLWDAGPSLLQKQEEWHHRYTPADLLRDLEDVKDDEATSNLLIAKLAEQLIADHYRINRRWKQKVKRCLPDLEHWDSIAAHLTRIALQPGSIEERYNALQQLAEHVLSPIGGLMPLEWSTEWEELSS